MDSGCRGTAIKKNEASYLCENLESRKTITAN